MNLLLAGELWQLPHVRASAIFSNPFKAGYSFEEQKIFNMFWRKGADSTQRTFLLTQSLRTKDPWLEVLLEADRYGRGPWEM